MKLNSNTVIVENKELGSLVNLAEGIAKKNNIFDVGEASISLNPEQGSIDFKTLTPGE